MEEKKRLPISEEVPGREIRKEKSCGAVVVCTEGGRVRFLLTRSLRGVWGFPKGHVEGRETEHETALREIREETGLAVRFTEGFRETDEYLIVKKSGPAIDKLVVFFLADYERAAGGRGRRDPAVRLRRSDEDPQF